MPPPPASGQQPSPDQIQQALQQPGAAELLRTRIRESGLTAEQIRAQLMARGYPADALDRYLPAAQGMAPEPGAQVLAAAAALGMPVAVQHLLPTDTGFITRQRQPPSRVFGVDALRRSTTQFLPLLAGPVPSDYRLGPGDVLVLILTGDVELAYTLPVTREGFMLVPQVGQVFVSNLTLEQLRDLLYSRLGRVYSGVRRSAGATTRFDISVANVRANQVYVAGEVTQPGAYQISALATVLTALYAAGGVTEQANTRDVQVQRLGKRVATFDLYDYLLDGDTRSDIRLETGDVVFVGVRGTRVDVAGAVIRPAIYEMKGGESLADLLRAAGGFRPDASFRKVTVQRILPASDRTTEALARVAIEVALAPLPTTPGRGERGEGRPGQHGSPERRESGERRAVGGGAGAINGVVVPAFTLEDGDSVVVDPLPNTPEAYFVAVGGMVQQPGRFPWRPGITLRDLMRLANGPRVGADLREAEIARLPPDRAAGQLATVVRVPLDSSYLIDRDSAGHYVGAPGPPFAAPGTAPDVPLEPFDNVLILRQPDFELQRTVTITGQVRYPGAYALQSKDERLAALITRAGGLTPQAYPDGIRFFRPQSDAGRINVNLPRALRDARSRDNVILQPGDSILIPEYLPSVKVSGAVNSPGSVLWRRGAGLAYYLSAAGGFSRVADKGAVSVRFANGEARTRSRFLFFRSDPSPGPGSEVLVPAEDPSVRKTDFVALFGALAQILASTVAIIVVATR